MTNIVDPTRTEGLAGGEGEQTPPPLFLPRLPLMIHLQ
jgi:hypothetical protein